MPGCDGLGPSPPAHCAAPASDDPIARVVRAASSFSAGGDFCALASTMDPGVLPSIPRTLAALGGMKVARVSRTERIIAQNAALRLALCGSKMGLEHETIVKALTVVAHLAFAPAELDGLGDAPDSAIEAWVGKASTWSDRKLPAPVAFHEMGFGLTRTSRPIRSGALWANVGQAVAVDTEWRAHVTPVIVRLELHRAGSVEAACTATLDLAWLRCGAPMGLHLVDPSAPAQPKDEGSLVLRPHTEWMQCAMCHGAGAPRSLEASPSEIGLSARREKSLHELEQRIAVLRDAAP